MLYRVDIHSGTANLDGWVSYMNMHPIDTIPGRLQAVLTHIIMNHQTNITDIVNAVKPGGSTVFVTPAPHFGTQSGVNILVSAHSGEAGEEKELVVADSGNTKCLQHYLALMDFLRVDSASDDEIPAAFSDFPKWVLDKYAISDGKIMGNCWTWQDWHTGYAQPVTLLDLWPEAFAALSLSPDQISFMSCLHELLLVILNQCPTNAAAIMVQLGGMTDDGKPAMWVAPCLKHQEGDTLKICVSAQQNQAPPPVELEVPEDCQEAHLYRQLVNSVVANCAYPAVPMPFWSDLPFWVVLKYPHGIASGGPFGPYLYLVDGALKPAVWKVMHGVRVTIDDVP